jgi:DNA-binding NarL/FixJ family response regulator
MTAEAREGHAMPPAGSHRIRVAVQAADPISRAGLTSYLDSRPELVIVPTARLANVLVIAPERLSAGVLAEMRKVAEGVRKPVVLVIDQVSESDLLAAVECRVVAILHRAATGEQLLGSVLAAAAGGAVMPPQLLGELLKHVERLQREVLAPQGLNTAGLSSREVDVLRLMADGMDTGQIADQLCYSERTVKNVIYGLTTRLNLRSRSHAVAFALRAGVI